MPSVRLVTPASNADPHKGVRAFRDEFVNELGWPGNVYTPYWAADIVGGLDAAVHGAVTDGAAPDVIVTDGSMATNKVLEAVANVVGGGGAIGAAAANIAIIQAVGGAPFAGRNITGFYINSLGTCRAQLAAAGTATVCILYDAMNDPSVPIHDDLVANPAGKALVWLNLADLIAHPDQQIVNGSTFMLIPSANFYIKRHDIAQAVHSRIAQVTAVVYPEGEYKQEHPAASRAKIKVRGHHVPSTFRQAAHLADQILRGEVSVAAASLPLMKEAEKHQD